MNTYRDYAARQHPLQMWRKLHRLIRLLHKRLWMNLSSNEQQAYRFHPGVNPQEIAFFAEDDLMCRYPATCTGMREAIQMLEAEQWQQSAHISARMLHEASLSTDPTACPWSEVTPEQKARYEKMAHSLNSFRDEISPFGK